MTTKLKYMADNLSLQKAKKKKNIQSNILIDLNTYHPSNVDSRSDLRFELIQACRE